MAVVAPDDTYTTEEAGHLLRCSARQEWMFLANGRLHGRRPGARGPEEGDAERRCSDSPWVVTALAVWRYLGIEEMTRVWLT